MNLPDITEKIDKYHEDNQSNRRPYLGGSQIGQSCRRATWYDFRWATYESFNGRMLRLFRHGYAYEPLFIEDLQNIGYTVLTKHRKTGKDIGFSDMCDHFKGHVDGIAKAKNSDEWVLLEFKTHSEKSFRKLVKDKVRKAKPQHYGQMQVYMNYMKLKRALYLAVNKNTDELYSEWIDYSDEDATQLIHRAGVVIHSEVPLEPISTDENSFDCRFCTHKKVCYKKQIPQFSCRTCKHATPAIDGEWSCGLHEKSLDADAQRIGCTQHEFIPALVEGIEEPKEKKLPEHIDWYVRDMQKEFQATVEDFIVKQ